MAAFIQYLQTWEAGMRRCFSNVGARGITKGRGDAWALGWVSGWSPAPWKRWVLPALGSIDSSHVSSGMV